MQVPFSPHPLQHLLFVDFFDDGHLGQCEVHLIVVLICVYLIISDAERPFTCLLVICMPSLERYLFRSSVHFLIVLLVFFILSSLSCIYILEINLLSVASFANVLSHSEGCLFILFIVFYDMFLKKSF